MNNGIWPPDMATVLPFSKQISASWKQVFAAYDPTQERIRGPYYLRDISRLKKSFVCKPCLRFTH